MAEPSDAMSAHGVHAVDPSAAERAHRHSRLYSRLCTASLAGDTAVVQYLLDQDADPDAGVVAYCTALPKGGASPLYAASSGGHVEVARLLLAYNADPDKGKAITGSTGLHLASFGGNVPLAQVRNTRPIYLTI